MTTTTIEAGDLELRRGKAGALELRKSSSSGKTSSKLRGYAAIWGSLSEDMGGFRERFAAGAFEEYLDEGGEVLAFLDHDSGRILGRRSAGTLQVEEDETGLAVEIDTPDTTAGRDAVELVRRGDLESMSFGFFAEEEDIDRDGEEVLRTVKKARIPEVSLVAFPAYPATSIGGARSFGGSPAVRGQVDRLRKILAIRERGLDLTAAELLDARGLYDELGRLLPHRKTLAAFRDRLDVTG